MDPEWTYLPGSVHFTIANWHQALIPKLKVEGWGRPGPYPQAIIRGMEPARQDGTIQPLIPKL